MDFLRTTCDSVCCYLTSYVNNRACGSTKIHDAMIYMLSAPGKCLRSSLVIASSRLYALSDSCVLPVAAAVECLHTYSLIHDDLPAMDNADVRRGQPSCHKKFGEAAAILTGDALLTLAFEIIASQSSAPLSAEKRCQLIQALAQASGMNGMVAGQMLDLEAPHHTLSKEEILHLQTLKTGALIQFCALAGAIIADAQEEDFQALKTYGHWIGLAFQITDDLLDDTADSLIIGKPAKQDAKAQKATLISYLGKDYAISYAEECIEKALNALSIFDERCFLLKEIATYILTRNK